MTLESRLNGVDLFGEPITRKPSGPIAQKFQFPPFSVLDARSGDWQERKRAWIGIGLRSEIGRGKSLSYAMPMKSYSSENMIIEHYGEDAQKANTSVFDPVLCEIAYRWFCPDSGTVVDPFAGGSVRGIVAGMMGRRYWGIDLRSEQIEANNNQANEIMPQIMPEWVVGDSSTMLDCAPKADFVFSCPPYGDLERYSDDPLDLSTMNHDDFLRAYEVIIRKSVLSLKDNRFACFVVGDYRNKKGFYSNFVSHTIQAFQSAGAKLYNEAILVTSVGSASMRVSKQFESGRKMAKTHQNVLVFVKGDWKIASLVASGKSKL